MLVDFLLVSIIIGLVRRGSLNDLANMPFKKIEGIFLSFAIRYIPLVLRGELYEIAVLYHPFIVATSYILLLYVLFLNWHIKPLRLVALGVFLNFLVIIANGGKMPVSVPTAEAVGLYEFIPLLSDADYLYHTAVSGTTSFKYLGDIIPLPPPYPKPRVFSIGDLAMGIGVFFTLQEGMLKKTSSGDKNLYRYR